MFISDEHYRELVRQAKLNDRTIADHLNEVLRKALKLETEEGLTEFANRVADKVFQQFAEKQKK